MPAPLVLLGPQRLRPTLRETVDALGVSGNVATVTAGWEEREGEDSELHEHLSGRSVNLRLFPRAEQVFAEDPSIYDAFLRRRDRMRELSDVHRPRLQAALQAARDLMRRRREGADSALVEPEIEHALGAVRDLDRHHLARVAAVDAGFAEEAWADPRPSVQRHRAEVAELLAGVDLLAIAGGHVGILMNRLRLFDVLGAHGAERPVVAWSAGAMALTERVVLFHDSPPQGRGDAEIYGPGLGLARGVVVFPHARRRLDLDDPDRVELLARRFAPDRCVAMDEGARLEHDGDWRTIGAARELRA